MTPTPDFADLTPPDELVQKWRYEWLHLSDTKVSPYQYIISQAARWGAQQGYQRGADDELESCCTWLDDHGYIVASPNLRAARRIDRLGTAAALRAAVEANLPEEPKRPYRTDRLRDERQRLRREFLALADELEQEQ